MSTLSKEKKSLNHERILYQLDDEDIKEYKMLLDYIQFQNIPDLVRVYHVSTRTIYNIKKKNKWNERIAAYQKKCSNIYIKETFGLINKYHDKKRDNLMNLALSVQNVVENFNECIYMDPLVQQQIFKKDQTEMINIVRQSTRALIDLQKLDTVILEKLKFFGIDLSPEAIQKFEQEEILGDSMLEQEFDTKEIIGNSPFRPYCHTNSMKYFKDVVDEYFYNEPNSEVAPIETHESPENKTQNSVIEPVETPISTMSLTNGGGLSETLQTQLTKTQNFIENTKKQLEEMEKNAESKPNSSVVERVETSDDEMPNDTLSSAGGGGCEADGGGFSEEDKYYEEDDEEYYDELAPENYRYPFPVEYLIPVTEW